MFKFAISILALSSAVLGWAADLSPADQQEVVTALTREMTGRYVVKEQAGVVAKLLNRMMAEGEFKSATDPSAFAEALQKAINSVCHDAHLRVRYSPTVLPKRTDAGEPSAAEIEEMKREVRFRNAGFNQVSWLDGNIGYLKFDYFAPSELADRPLKAAMSFLSETKALIIDIRSNGGGSPDTVRKLCDYFFAKPTHVNSLLIRNGDKMETRKFVTVPVQEFAYFDKPIYVLTSRRTGSGAEEFAYDLQTQKRATVIGDRTWGGANPGGVVRLNDHFSAFIPHGMAKNPVTGTNWEGTGVTPDIATDPDRALEKALELAGAPKKTPSGG